MNDNEIPYTALKSLRFMGKEGLCLVEPGEIFTLDGDEGINPDQMLAEGAAIINQKRIEELNNGTNTC